jgi:hypothetical protein
MDTVIFGFSVTSILFGIGYALAFAVGTAFVWLFFTVIIRSIEFWIATIVTAIVVMLIVFPAGA